MSEPLGRPTNPNGERGPSGPTRWARSGNHE